MEVCKAVDSKERGQEEDVNEGAGQRNGVGEVQVNNFQTRLCLKTINRCCLQRDDRKSVAVVPEHPGRYWSCLRAGPAQRCFAAPILDTRLLQWKQCLQREEHVHNLLPCNSDFIAPGKRRLEAKTS